MQSSKRYFPFVFRFSVLYCILFKMNDVYSQVGEKSRKYCAAQAPAGSGALNLPAIVGSARASENEYPHMVGLGYFNESNRQWGCGGTLISEDFVLTAAHCLYAEKDFNAEVQVVRLGTKNILEPTPGYKDCEISQRIQHPGYKPPQEYNDIGLLRLRTSVAFTSKIKPACLQVNTNFDAATMSVTGWGRQGDGQLRSPYLLKMHLVLYNYTACEPYYGHKGPEYPHGLQMESMICAGGSKDEVKGICQGDSGGPLQILIKQQYYVVGVVAVGYVPCGLPNVPSIYTRVSNYTQWIEDNVWQ